MGDQAQSQKNYWVGVVAIICFGLLMAFNLWRALDNAGNSLGVYQSEQASLAALQEQNESLLNELRYYQSYEYKRIYARDNLRMAEPGEKLYLVVDTTPAYYTPDEEFDLFAAQDFASWWGMLLWE